MKGLSEKAVLHFKNKQILKGYVVDFSPSSQRVTLIDTNRDKTLEFNIAEMKAVFFVRDFEGNSGYREKKMYGLRKTKGKKIFVRFKDRESITGYLEGGIPWDKGFFLSQPNDMQMGFFILPTDEESNNIKVFVVNSSVEDVTVMP